METKITLTIADDALAILESWRKKQAHARDVAGQVIQLRWETLADLLNEKCIVATNALISDAYAWAVGTKDASLPGAVTAALQAREDALAAVDAVAAAAIMAVPVAVLKPVPVVEPDPVEPVVPVEP
jgi:hypothetical protein